MDWRKGLHRLQFHNEAAFYQQIHSKTFIEMHAIEVERDAFLAFYVQPAFFQHPRKNHFINGFQQSWTEVSMEMERSIYDYGRGLLNIHCRSLRAFASSREILANKQL